jgi:dephospho-CoA kinase
MMKNGAIGLTGGIACGKSTVAEILQRDGIPVMDTDAVAHSLLSPDHRLFEKIVQQFGSEFVNAEGLMDRNKLGNHIFADSSEREKLNAIMHPEIFSMMHLWLNEQLAKHRYALVIVPLLYETAVENEFEKVLVVAADEKRVLDRLRNRGLTEIQARLRIQSQLPLADKMARADGVIWNNGDLTDLMIETRRIWNKTILGKE